MDNYEEKYKSALKWMQSLYDGLHGATKVEAEKYFPELQESEDERIRKALIEYFEEQCDMSDWNGVYGYQVLAWLEKQGEKFTAIDVDKMVMEYSHTKDGDFGLPVNCMTRAYRKGINDALKVKQCHMLDPEKVIEWLKHCNITDCDMRTSIIPDSSPTSIPHRVRWFSEDFIDKFKKDIGL